MKIKFLTLIMLAVVVLSGCTYKVGDTSELYYMVGEGVGYRLNYDQPEFCKSDSETIYCLKLLNSPYLLGTWMIPDVQDYIEIYRENEYLMLSFSDGTTGVLVYRGINEFFLVVGKEVLTLTIVPNSTNGQITIEDTTFNMHRVNML